jgi:hypothetical protein
MDVVPAPIAGVRRTARYTVMFCDPIADLAFDAIGVQILAQPLQAGGIVGKLLFEVLDRIPNGFTFNVIPELLVCHEAMVSEQVPTVKG